MTPTEREALEHARHIVAGLSAQVAAGIRPVDCADLIYWRKRVRQLSTRIEQGPPDAA